MLSRYDEDSRTNNRMPSGVDMTVGELQQMAARQQHQIEAQQQALVAKEQRLKYLKQQELRQQQLANENERLRQLRERVESQEQKLKRLRALRDEVTERRNSGSSLMSELESIKALFNDKEKELAMAVTRVENLTQQLDSLQKADTGDMTTNKAQTPIIIELEKLRNELRIRNELNEQQNNKLRQQRDSLATRRQQVVDMDKRIEELQARLNKKRALQSERQRGEIEAGRSNVAAVAPFVDGNGDKTFSLRDTKYQTLPRGIKLHSVDNRQLDKYILEVNCREGRSQKEAVNQATDAKYMSSPTSSASFTSHVMTESGMRSGTNLGLYTARPFGSTYSAVPSGTPSQSGINWPKTSTPITSGLVASPETEIFITAAPVPTITTVSMSKTYTPLTVSLPQGVTVQSAKTASPVYQVATSRLQPPSQPQLTQDPPSPSMSPTVTSTNEPPVTPPVSWGPGGSPVTTDRRPAQPPSPGQFAVTNSTKVTLSDRLKSKVPLPSTFEVAGNSDQTSTIAATSSSPAVTSEILPASNTKSTLRALIESTRPVSDSTLEPTKKSMSVSSALSVLMSSSSLSPARGTGGKPAYRYAPKSVIQNTYTGKLGSSALDNYRKNMSQLYRGFNVMAPGSSELPSPTTSDTKDMSPTSVDPPATISPIAKVSPVTSQPNMPSPMARDEMTGNERRPETSPAVPYSPSRSPSRSPHIPKGTSPQEVPGEPDPAEEVPLEGSPPRISHMQKLCRRNSLIEATTSFSSLDPQQEEVSKSPPTSAVVVRRRKGNLKNKDSVKSSRRVSFDPLALLLDASLEGELELVMRTAKQVPDPSASNDEGITALHNAICAGHYDIVRFLVEYGCDINAPDSDGWTPLHCAASCNNLAMVKFLVEHGACVFATTISDHETAAEKCEEDEDGYDGCSEYLYSIQEKLGVVNRGIVYAVFDFVAQNPDELCFNCSDKLVVLRKGDEREKEWWWAQIGPREGYMPRNLVGLFPRVVPQFSGPSQDDDE